MRAQVIGKRLMQLRGNRRREDVAHALNISENALFQYEMGARIPRDEVKWRISFYYNESIERLFFSQKVHE